MITKKQNPKNIMLYIAEEGERLNNYLDDDQIAMVTNNIRDDKYTKDEEIEAIEYLIACVDFRGGNSHTLKEYLKLYKQNN